MQKMKKQLGVVYGLIALIHLAELSGTFHKQTTWPTVAGSELTTLEGRSKIECALHLNTGGHGFAFNKLENTCYLLHCVNPNLVEDSADMPSIDVYLVSPLTADYTLARGKPASLSTTQPLEGGFTFEAGKAVDGIYLPDGVHEHTSMAHATYGDKNPWWRVNLQQVYCVWGVKILNRAYSPGGEWEFNKDVDVTVSRNETQLMYDINPNSRCNYYDGSLNQYWTSIACVQALRGQFVQIQYRPNDDTLMFLYEIEVFGV